MSNILKNREQLVFLKDIISYISKNELTKDYLEEILKLLIPNDNGNNLINFKVKEKGNETAVFKPQCESLDISLNKINRWLELNTNDLAEFYKVKDTDTLKCFLFLFVITHEIEHSYQYLIAQKLISSPCKTIQCGYKGIFDLFLPDNSIILHPIKQTRNAIALTLYKRKENFFVLERNANIECTDLLCQLANYMGRIDIFEMFNSMKNSYLRMGYKKTSKGNLEETYKEILLYDRYQKFYEEENMTEEEKIRYGLNISDQAKEKILKIQ